LIGQARLLKTFSRERAIPHDFSEIGGVVEREALSSSPIYFTTEPTENTEIGTEAGEAPVPHLESYIWGVGPPHLCPQLGVLCELCGE
jgi:hypothetical protein